MNRTVDEAEVVVIGGGVVGMATAYYTSMRGKDVVLVDKGIPGWEASGRNGGWAGAGGKAGGAVAAENSTLWSGLEDELGQSIEFVQGGSLHIALTEEEATRIEANAQSSRAAGGEVRVVDLQEMQDILPSVTEKALRGTFNPGGSHANPQLTCEAWRRALERRGVRVRDHTKVTGVMARDGQIKGVETDRGVISSLHVVNAAGPWAHLINEMVGLSSPPRPVLIEILCTLPLPPVTKATFGGNALYCRQAVSGQLHFGGWNAVHKDVRVDERLETSSLVTGDIASRFVEMVPGLRHAKVLRTWAGVIARTPDDLPVIDALDCPKGFYVNMGFGGGGFAFSPVAGKIVSELIVDGRSRFDISAFSLSRMPGISDFETMAMEPV